MNTNLTNKLLTKVIAYDNIYVCKSYNDYGGV